MGSAAGPRRSGDLHLGGAPLSTQCHRQPCAPRHCWAPTYSLCGAEFCWTVSVFQVMPGTGGVSSTGTQRRGSSWPNGGSSAITWGQAAGGIRYSYSIVGYHQHLARCQYCMVLCSPGWVGGVGLSRWPPAGPTGWSAAPSTPLVTLGTAARSQFPLLILLTKVTRAARCHVPAVRLVMVEVAVSTSSRSCVGTASHGGCAMAVPCPHAPAHRAAPLWGAQQRPPAVSCPALQQQRIGVDSSEGCEWDRVLRSWGGGTQCDGPIPQQHPALQLSLPVGSCTTSSTVTVCRVCQVSWGEPSPKGKLRHRDSETKTDFGDLPGVGWVAQRAGSCSPGAAADTAGGALPQPLPSRAGGDRPGSAGVRRRHG